MGRSAFGKIRHGSLEILKMDSLFSRIEGTLQKHRMISPGERILVACSGGADSAALFHLLRELALKRKIRLALVHFDHGLRKESAKDFRFVRELARQFGIPFYGGRAKRALYQKEKHLSPEEKARELRYDFFFKTAKKTRIRKIALGHHQDDQAETVLMRILQGTGLRGLQGIRPVAQSKGVTYLRPLIEVTRAELREYLGARRLPYREDGTNRSLRFLRNRVRHLLLPLLEREFNPKIRNLLVHLARTVSVELKGLEDWVGRHWKLFMESQRDGTLQLDRELFLFLPEALQFRILDQALHSLDRRSGLDFSSWEVLQAGFRKGRVRMTLPRNLDLSLTKKKLLVRVCLRPGSEK